MANFAEKNNVDISKLFNWGSKFSILDAGGKEVQEIYIRVIGDADLNKARVLSLKTSAEMRRKLKDLNSDERLAYIPDKESLTKEQLVEYILGSKAKALATEIVKEMNLDFPKELEDDSALEDQEKYQAEIDSWEINRNERTNKLILSKIDKEREVISNRNLDDLYTEYETNLVNNVCENEMYKSFIDWCTYFSCYKDAKYTKKFFSSYEEFANIPTFIKDQLLKFYSSLDIKIDDLK